MDASAIWMTSDDFLDICIEIKPEEMSAKMVSASDKIICKITQNLDVPGSNLEKG